MSEEEVEYDLWTELLPGLGSPLSQKERDWRQSVEDRLNQQELAWNSMKYQLEQLEEYYEIKKRERGL